MRALTPGARSCRSSPIPQLRSPRLDPGVGGRALRSTGHAAEAAQEEAAAAFLEEDRAAGSPWAVLSVTTVGALLASVQGSALIIALPKILTALRIDFLTIMWVLLGYLLITTALVPIAGRL